MRWRKTSSRRWARSSRISVAIDNSIYECSDTVDTLKDLILFMRSKDEKLVTLKEYVERMPESQKKIYYATAKDKETIEHLPQLETLKDKGYEVLYLLDPVDEFCVETIREYEGKSFQSISRGDLDLDDAESQEVKKETEEIQKDNGDLLKDIKDVLGDKVAEVKVSARLKSSAVCLVADANGPSLSMEQTFQGMDNPMFKAKRILEINPHHQLFQHLQQLHEGGKDSQEFKDYCGLLYSQALLMEGMLPDNPVELAQKLAQLMAK